MLSFITLLPFWIQLFGIVNSSGEFDASFDDSRSVSNALSQNLARLSGVPLKQEHLADISQKIGPLARTSLHRRGYNLVNGGYPGSQILHFPQPLQAKTLNVRHGMTTLKNQGQRRSKSRSQRGTSLKSTIRKPSSSQSQGAQLFDLPRHKSRFPTWNLKTIRLSSSRVRAQQSDGNNGNREEESDQRGKGNNEQNGNNGPHLNGYEKDGGGTSRGTRGPNRPQGPNHTGPDPDNTKGGGSSTHYGEFEYRSDQGEDSWWGEEPYT